VAVVCAAAGLDAVLSRGRLTGISVRLPDILRLVKDRQATFESHVTRRGAEPEHVRLGLVAPPALNAQDELRVTLPPAGENFVVPWTLHPSQRGSFTITTAMVETSSVAGLWALRERRPARSDIRVYPNLLSDRKTAASLLLPRSNAGAHVQRPIGKGREFEKLREYIPGDTYSDIHWRATARHGRPVTKVYQVERTQEVYAVLDCSRLSGRMVDGEPALEKYLNAALLLGLAIQADGDLFGVVAFDKRVRTIVRAAAGRTHFGTCRDALYAVTPTRVSPDYRELAQFLRARLRKRSLLMVLTDLDDVAIAEEFERNVSVLRRTHLVTAHMIRPAGVAPLFTGDPVTSDDEIFDRLGGHLRWQKLSETRKRLSVHGVALTLLDASRVAPELVANYRDIKRRQLL
jgi:uncharacterized protein (DUF58 family)